MGPPASGGGKLLMSGATPGDVGAFGAGVLYGAGGAAFAFGAGIA